MDRLCTLCAAGPRDGFGRIFVRDHSLYDPGFWAWPHSAQCMNCLPSSDRAAKALKDRDDANLESQINAFYGGHNLF